MQAIPALTVSLSAVQAFQKKNLSGRHTLPPIDRYLLQTDRSGGVSSCWPWHGSKLKNGYCYFRINNRNIYIHRWVFFYFNGSIPDGYEIDHTCNNIWCANPNHLDAVTPEENKARARARRTHCQYGHAFDAINTYISHKGHRSCRICLAAKQRQRRLVAV